MRRSLLALPWIALLQLAAAIALGGPGAPPPATGSLLWDTSMTGIAS